LIFHKSLNNNLKNKFYNMDISVSLQSKNYKFLKKFKYINIINDLNFNIFFLIKIFVAKFKI